MCSTHFADPKLFEIFSDVLTTSFVLVVKGGQRDVKIFVARGQRDCGNI